MFFGTYYNSIDGKNRMIVPSRQRESLGENCVLTKGLDQCLYIYTVEDWEKEAERISGLPKSDPKVRAYFRDRFSTAAMCSFDKQGRIIIPNHLKEFANIDHNLVTMGVMEKIEIWAEEVWNSSDAKVLGESESTQDVISEYGL